jgi:hypothetical protein
MGTGMDMLFEFEMLIWSQRWITEKNEINSRETRNGIASRHRGAHRRDFYSVTITEKLK